MKPVVLACGLLTCPVSAYDLSVTNVVDPVIGLPILDEFGIPLAAGSTAVGTFPPGFNFNQPVPDILAAFTQFGAEVAEPPLGGFPGFDGLFSMTASAPIPDTAVPGDGSLFNEPVFVVVTNSPGGIAFATNLVVIDTLQVFGKENAVGIGGQSILLDAFMPVAYGIPVGGPIIIPALGGNYLSGVALSFLTPSITVTTTADELDVPADAGTGVSLREAIRDVPPGGFIEFDPSLDGETITLTMGELAIAKDLAIDGFGLSSGITVSGGGTTRVFHISAGLVVDLSALIIADGDAASGGGISNAGTLTLAECTITGNIANDGGGIQNTGMLTVERCTIVGNEARAGGGGISSNTASAVLVVSNSTVTGNRAVFGGGILARDSNFDMYHGTVAGNTGTAGSGGIVITNSTVVLEDSLVAANAGSVDPDIGGSGSSLCMGGNNIIGENTGPYANELPADGILIGDAANPVNPRLAPLSRYGGRTRTMHPLAGSPAIDGGFSPSTPADQRGFSGNSGAAPDIGAVEGGPVITVVNTDDDGAGSLRQAIVDAGGAPGTRIYFDPAVFPARIGTNSQLTVGGGRNVFIDASDIPGGVAIAGGGSSRVFLTQGQSTVAMHGLKMTGGDASPLAIKEGGGIRNIDRTDLTLIECTVAGNRSPDSGGGISSNGAGSTLTLFRCTVSDNAAGSNGGGIRNNGGSSAILFASSVTGNTSAEGGGGIVLNGASRLELVNSTVSGNSARTFGGGVWSNTGSTTTVLTNVTITRNDARSDGGGVRNQGGLTIQNTIVAGNTAFSNQVDLFAVGGSTVTSLGGNLLGSNQGMAVDFPAGTPNVNDDYVGLPASPLDPLLGELGGNGALTRTHALLAGSPAIDAGQTNLLAADQRGVRRVRDGDRDATATIDIGAYEAPPTIVVDTAVDENDGPGAGAGTSLRDAIAAATDPDGTRIDFDPTVFNGEPGDEIILTLGQLTVDGRNVEIDATRAGNATISGGGTVRCMEAINDSRVTLRRLTFVDGRSGFGGAVRPTSGTNMLIDSCFFTNNTATIAGGAIQNFSAYLDVRNSTFTANTNNLGAAVAAGGDTILTNCTIDSNNGDGVYTQQSVPPILVNHCTITDNTEPGLSSSPSGAYLVRNSIVTGNSGTSGPDVSAQAMTGGGNLIGDNSGATAEFPAGLPNANGDFVGSPGTAVLDPALEPLGSSGGPTRVRRPLAGSLALDNAGGSTLCIDQRGAKRPDGPGSDIGAVEARQRVVVDLAADTSDDPFSGGLSLREAIDFADPVGPVITFSPRLDGQRIVLEGGELTGDAGKSFSIDASSLPRGLTIDADGNSRVFLFNSAGSISLANLTITGGNGAGRFPGFGGGILNVGTPLALTGCTLHDNFAVSGGGGVAISNSPGQLASISGCTISGNRTAVRGGGIYAERGRTELTNCTVTANSAPLPSAGRSGGGGAASWSAATAEFVIRNSIVAGNDATDIEHVGTAGPGGFMTSGSNLIGTGGPTAVFTGAGDIANVPDPGLSPLGCYGGPTPVHHPLAASLAIDTG
ncbi:MAG: hypothetical protein HKO57_13695, partial [Akkermansiaceae bacterium]|nr:hypothetical protein [Akkermansiaceae bacterium]